MTPAVRPREKSEGGDGQRITTGAKVQSTEAKSTKP